MFCAKCGTQNVDDAAFCLNCGAPMSPDAEEPIRSSATQGYKPASAPERPQRPAVEGNIGAAWRDITNSDGWLKKVAMLLLIGCVPILNIAVEGYGIRWARELSFGQRAGLPGRVFKKREISTGFFAWLVRLGLGLAFFLAAAIVTLLLSSLFGVVNRTAGEVVFSILFVALAIFFVFFYSPVVDASVMRMAVVGYLEAGFNFKEAWRAFRSNMGGLIGASIIPRLVVGIAGVVVVLLIVFIENMIAGAGARALSSDPTSLLYTMNSSRALGSFIGSMGFGLLFFQVILFVLTSMFNVFSMLFTHRAVGHWVARTAPEWADESDEGLDSDNAGGFGLENLTTDAPEQS